MDGLSDILKSNPFYGKTYAVIGKVPIEDECYKFDEQFEFLGAIRRKTLSKNTDFVFVADKPTLSVIEKSKQYADEGHLTRLPYYAAANIAREVKKYDINKLTDSNFTEQNLLNTIITIITKAKAEGDYTLLGQFLNDRHYHERLVMEEHIEEVKKKEKKKEIIIWGVLGTIVLISVITNTWMIFGFIGLLVIFPKLGVRFIKTFLRR